MKIKARIYYDNHLSNNLKLINQLMNINLQFFRILLTEINYLMQNMNNFFGI